jgi:fatty-acyl-CoA synthase
MADTDLLSSLYRARLAAAPGQAAFHVGEKTWSIAEFDGLVRRTAVWAETHGVREGDHVAVWLVNRVEWLAWFFALARLGATVVAVNTRFRSHELEYILERSGARFLVMQAGFHRIDFGGVLSEVDAGALTALETIVMLDADASHQQLLGRPVLHFDPSAADADAAPDREDAKRPAIMFTTSGTTKGPKLVMHSATTLTRHTRGVARLYALDQPGAVPLAVLPLCGVFGLNSALAALVAGAPIVMQEVFDAAETLALMQRHGVTHFFGSDEMLRRIDALAVGERPLPALRLAAFAAFSAGAPELAEQLGRRGFPLRGLYGSSEVQALFSLQSDALPLPDRALGGGLPCGAPHGDTHVRVRNPETGVLCGHEVAGEIEISAPTNFIGYLNNPQASADAFTPDGYFRTGDLGYTRADGSFVYLARMGDAMRLGGFLVDPSEIEYAMGLHGGVEAVQVVAVEIGGQPRPVAFVRGQGSDEDARRLRDTVAASLAAFKVPARIWFVDEFPATASANGVKVQRNKLRDLALARLAEEAGVGVR